MRSGRPHGLAAPVLGLTCSVIAGCGPSAFHAQFEERAEPEVSIVLGELESIDAGRADNFVAVVVTSEPRGLRAVSLVDGSVLWEQQTEVRSTPVVAGAFVVTDEGRVRVRRVADGREVGSVAGSRFLGATGDVERVVISLAEGSEQSPRGRLVMVNEGGGVWEHELTLGVGVAGLAGGVVVVPWATQRVSFLDAADGHERARLRFTDRVVGRAWVEGDRVLLGQHDVWSASRAMADPARVQGWRPAGRPLPGQPPLLADGYAPVPAPEAAENRVRLTWRPRLDEEGAASATDDTLYFVFYRLVFALEANSDAVRWVHVHRRDVVGARAVPGGLWIADEAGNLVALSAADGRSTARRELGSPIVAAAIGTGRPLPEPEGETEEPPPLGDQLLAAARLGDNRLGGGRGLAARYLGEISGAGVTEHLVDLCSDRDAPEPARRPACDALAGRTEGEQHVRVALGRHGSFLAGTPSPPSGPLARAAASMNLRAAVPLLVNHLDDPSTPTAEIPELMQGLAALGVRAAAPRIASFVRLYHATEDPGVRRAVVAGVHALRELDGGTDWIAELSADPFTPAPLVDQLRAEVAQQERDAARAGAAERAAERAPRRPEEPAPARPANDDRPERITAQITRQVFAPVERRLRACIESGSIRLSFLVSGDGEIGAVLVTPNDARECVEPIVRELRFPATRAGIREQVVHRISR